MKTNTEARIEKLAKTMGKAIAKLATTDASAAAAMSRAAQQLADDIRAGRL